MFRIKLLLFTVLALSGDRTLRASEEEDAFSCANAGEALREIQGQQMTLTPRDSAKSLLELEQNFDRERAHLTLLKGMQRLNREYRQFKKLLQQQDAASPHSPKELLQLSGELLEHHDSVQRADVAHQILTILSSDAPETRGALRRLLRKGEDITAGKVSALFNKHCHQSDTTKECRWHGDGRNDDPRFVHNMTSLLADVASRESGQIDRQEKKLNQHDCTQAKLKRFQLNIHTYRDTLLDKIEPSDLKSHFADEEWQKVEDYRQQLNLCTEKCDQDVKELNLAIVAYRDKVRELESVPDKAWDVLKKFNQVADKIRSDTWKKVKVNEARIEQFVRTENPDLELTEAERFAAGIRIARGEITDILSGDSYSLSREKMRRKFAKETHVRLEDFFSYKNVEKRLQHFNPILQDLLGSEKNFLSIDDNDKIVLNEELFFGHIDQLKDDEREQLQRHIDKEVLAAQNRLQSIGKAIHSIKEGEEWKKGERLKRYVFDRFRKNNCKQAKDVVSIRCRPDPNSNEQRNLKVLHHDFTDILAVMDTSQAVEPAKAFRQTCASSPRYHSACIIANREYRRRHPAGTIKEAIRAAKKRTFIYNSRGRRIDYILHDKSMGNILFEGVWGAFQQPQTLDSLLMLMTQNSFDDQLDDYIEWGQEEKTWYHQSAQYREYAEERWVEDMFNSLHPNFAPLPPENS